MFQSETYGKMNIEQIPDKILAFYDKSKNIEGIFQIVVGTDSQNFNDTKMVTVIAAYMVLCQDLVQNKMRSSAG